MKVKAMSEKKPKEQKPKPKDFRITIGEYINGNKAMVIKKELPNGDDTFVIAPQRLPRGN